MTPFNIWKPVCRCGRERDAQIGLTAAQVAALRTLVQNARKAYDTAQAARAASKAATAALGYFMGDTRGTSQEIDDIEQALSRLKSLPQSKLAVETLYDAASLIG